MRIRSDDIVASVSENISYIKPPIRNIFESFIGESTVISSDVKQALKNMKERIDNDVFGEWCDTLIACQDDRTLKDTLLSVVSKLTDVRIVNNELKTMLGEVQKEYWMMAALVVGNVPLIYSLNKDWFVTLMTSLPGKITLGVSGMVIIVTAVLMLKFTRPIEYSAVRRR